MRSRSRFTLHMICGLLIILAVSLALLGSTRFIAHAVGATLKLSSSSGHPSAHVSVSGTGFGSSETVSLAFDTTSVGTGTTDSTGAFRLKITIPGSAQSGTHNIQATGTSSGLSATASFLVETNWPLSGFDAQNTYFNPYENTISPTNVNTLVEDWSYYDNNANFYGPAIVNGVAYVGSDDGKVYAINAQTGALLWSYAAAAGFLRDAPAVANGVVYINSENNTVYALNAHTGVLLWSYTTSSGIQSSPTVSNGIVYIGDGYHTLYALDAQTGTLLWSYVTGGYGVSTPTVANGIVYVDAGRDKLYALNAKTGALLWSYPTGNNIALTWPAVVNGIVYVGANGNMVYALKAKTGTLLWSFTLSDTLYSSPAVANGVVYIGAYGNAPYNPNLYALNAQTGALLWSYADYTADGYPIDYSLTIANRVVYFGIWGGTLYAVNATTGTLLWSYHTLGTVIRSPVVANGILYFAPGSNPTYTNADILYAFHLP